MAIAIFMMRFKGSAEENRESLLLRRRATSADLIPSDPYYTMERPL
jgi:hypothetical protein